MEEKSSTFSPLHLTVLGTSKMIKAYDFPGSHYKITILFSMTVMWKENLFAAGLINIPIGWCTQPVWKVFFIYTVVFPPSIATIKEVLKSVMAMPCMKFKDIHEDCRKHVGIHYHKTPVAAAKAFLENVRVDVQMQSSFQTMIEANKQILSSITSCIMFNGTYDLPLRETDEYERGYLWPFKFDNSLWWWEDKDLLG